MGSAHQILRGLVSLFLDSQLLPIVVVQRNPNCFGKEILVILEAFKRGSTSSFSGGWKPAFTRASWCRSPQACPIVSKSFKNPLLLVAAWCLWLIAVLRSLSFEFFDTSPPPPQSQYGLFWVILEFQVQAPHVQTVYFP